MLKGWIILDEWSMNSHHLLRVLPLESIVQVIASQNLFIQRNFKKKIWVSGNIFNICFLMSPNHNFTFFFFLFFGVRRGGGGWRGEKGGRAVLNSELYNAQISCFRMEAHQMRLIYEDQNQQACYAKDNLTHSFHDYTKQNFKEKFRINSQYSVKHSNYRINSQTYLQKFASFVIN